MKNILTLLILLPLFSAAQDTCHLRKETDPFTHQVRISTGFVPFVSDGLKVSISVDATATDVDFFIWITSDPKCFDEASTIQINYEGDRLKANFKNSGDMNCEGAFHFSFRNTTATASNLERLTSRKISSIRLANGKVLTDISFTDQQKQIFMRMARCVVTEAKSLIKQ
ncbi:MAG: hypothetical protein ACJ75B_12105 [Flavisolibacter sp.]